MFYFIPIIKLFLSQPAILTFVSLLCSCPTAGDGVTVVFSCLLGLNHRSR